MSFLYNLKAFEFHKELLQFKFSKRILLCIDERVNSWLIREFLQIAWFGLITNLKLNDFKLFLF